MNVITRVIESIDTNLLNSSIREVIDKIMKPLDNHVKVSYVDETLMPNEMSIEFVWKHANGNEEYLGSWDINMNRQEVNDYTKYLNSISTEIQAIYSLIKDSINA